jgi:hypothetical protein
MWSNMNTRELFLREPSNIKTAESVRIKLDGTTPKKLFAGNSRNFLSHKVDPSLLKDLSLNEFSVIVKDRIKRIFKKY